MDGGEQILLIDNSNTRTKFMLACGEALLPDQRILPTAGMTPESVSSLLQGWRFGSVLVCSVVPATAAVLKSCFAAPVRFVDVTSPCGVSFDAYEGAATLGADRIANAVAIAERGYLPCVAVDLGTATTFDVVAPGPRFVGGAIAPGLVSFARGLTGSTAQLPEVPLFAPERVIGRNTTEAMQAGIMLGYREMVRGLLNSIAAELKSRPYVYATGGDAGLVASPLAEVDTVDPCLTFHGMRLIARRLF